MNRRSLLAVVALLALVAALATSIVLVWRAQERSMRPAVVVPLLPDLNRWPASFQEELLDATNTALKSDDPLPALARLARLYAANGFTAEALPLLRAAASLEPGNARWPYLAAEVGLRTDSRDAALRDLQATVDLAPGYAPAWISLGELLTTLERHPEAGEAYRRALQVDPGSVRARFAWLSFSALHGQKGASVAELTELARARPGIKQIHELLAVMYSDSGDPAAAELQQRLAAGSEHYLDTADPWLDELADDVFDSERLRLRAFRLRREHRFAEAAASLQRAVQLAPREPGLRKALSEIHETMNQPGLARSVLERAIEECPDEPGLWVRLVRLQSLAREPAVALATLDRAFALWPDDAVLHVAKGLTLRDAGRPEEAVDVLRRAVELDPISVDARYNLGLTLVVIGKAAEARPHLEATLAMRPDHPDALRLLAGLLLDAGEIAAAEPLVGRLIERSPEDARAQHLFATLHLRKGQALFETGLQTEAREMFREGLAKAPDFAPLLRESAMVNLALGDFTETTRLLERYLQIEKNDSGAYLMHGAALRETGRIDRARQVLEHGRAIAAAAGDQEAVAQFDRLLGM